MTATQDAPTPTAHSWPPGLPRSLDFPAVPVGSFLRAAVRRWGDRTAFVGHDVPLTYPELGARAHAVANWLADHGVGRGDVVAVHMPNCRQYPAVYYGVLLAGATFSPRSEERRVGEEGRYRGSPYHLKKKAISRVTSTHLI